ncbi:hypothetical protein [Embleya sp. NPDC005575]
MNSIGNCVGPLPLDAVRFSISVWSGGSVVIPEPFGIELDTSGLPPR